MNCAREKCAHACVQAGVLSTEHTARGPSPDSTLTLTWREAAGERNLEKKRLCAHTHHPKAMIAVRAHETWLVLEFRMNGVASQVKSAVCGRLTKQHNNVTHVLRD